jgi:hypothetical protein
VAAVPVVRVTSPAVVRHLGEVSKVLAAASQLLEAIANLLRQLVQVVGWLVLLAGSINLLLDPHLSIGHLVVPGAGSLAVLQGMIKPRRRRQSGNATAEASQTALPKAPPPSDADCLLGPAAGTDRYGAGTGRLACAADAGLVRVLSGDDAGHRSAIPEAIWSPEGSAAIKK